MRSNTTYYCIQYSSYWGKVNSEFIFTTDTLYLALRAEPRVVYCEEFSEKIYRVIMAPHGILDIRQYSHWSILVIFAGLIDRSWVDAYDPEGDNQYIQTRTDAVLPYANWNAGEPNNWWEKCVHFIYGGWNDVPCSATLPFACEYDVNWTPG